MRQFSSRGEDEAEQWLRFVEESLQDRKRKCSRLSATSFGETNNITILQGDGDGLFLDGGREFVVERFTGFA